MSLFLFIFNLNDILFGLQQVQVETEEPGELSRSNEHTLTQTNNRYSYIYEDVFRLYDAAIT